MEVDGDDRERFAVDLFGDLVPRFKMRGRPPHVVTAENRALVTMLLATGRDEAAIAGALGVSEPTLRKHYFSEIKGRASARLRVEGKLLAKLAEQAMGGDTGAAKKLLDRLDRSVPQPAKEKAKREVPLGLKEQRTRDAYKAAEGTGWAGLIPH